jgi:hypothetical protein
VGIGAEEHPIGSDGFPYRSTTMRRSPSTATAPTGIRRLLSSLEGPTLTLTCLSLPSSPANSSSRRPVLRPNGSRNS